MSAPTPTFPAAAFRPALLGVAGTVVAARVVAAELLDRLDVPTELYIIAFYTLVFGGLLITCRSVSRRFGTGDPFADFGLTWRPRDLWAGLGASLLARLFGAVVLLFFAGHLAKLNRFTEGIDHASTATFVIFAIAATIGAPIVEELVFRGMLMRSLTDSIGASRALWVQAGLFGLYHVAPGLGLTNVPYALSLAAAGLELGRVAARHRRLGPSSTAHFFFNALGVVVLWSAR